MFKKIKSSKTWFSLCILLAFVLVFQIVFQSALIYAQEATSSGENVESPTLQPSPTQSADRGELTAVVLQNASAMSVNQLDLNASNVLSSATITTDKPDYSPTDTAVIAGTNLNPNTTYVLYISSIDPPAVNFQTELKTDDKGEFVYAYQLDGNYRQNYSVELKDQSGNTVAQTTFTDAIQTDFSQCSNQNPTLNNCVWIGSILNAGNSEYFEGDTVPQRLLFRDAKIADGTHTISFTYQYTKGGIHAYDFLTTVQPDIGLVQGSPTLTLNPCADLGGADTTVCNSLNPGTNSPTQQITIPNDPFDSKDSIPGVGTGSDQTAKEQAYESVSGGPGSRKITVYADNASAFSSPSATLAHDPAIADSDTGDSEVLVTITFNSTGCNTGSGCNYLLYFGGHLGLSGNNNNTGSNWGPGLGSSQISGGPYHIKNVKFDGTGGSQDNQIQGASILIPNDATITIIKDTVPNDPQDFSFTPAGSGLSDFLLDDDGETSLLSNTKVFSGLAPGTYTVEEAVQAGFVLTGNTTCTDPTNNSNINLDTRTATIDLSASEDVTCTFTNTLQKAHLTLVKTVINDNGGTGVATDWTLNASGPTPISGTTGSGAVTNAAVNSGTYTLSESGGPSEYTASAYSCVTNDGIPLVSNSVTLASGDNATCTINNNDNAAHLIIIKHVINDNGGTKIASDFLTTISGVTTATPSAAGVESPGVDNTLTTIGSYSVDEGAHDGYEKTLSSDCSGTIGLGETKPCTITNNDIAPKLHLRKVVTNNNGGTATVSNFTLTANGTGPNDLSGTSPVDSDSNLKADTFALSESSVTGYAASAWNCAGGTQNDSDITLGLNEEATCTITNDDITPQLTVIKHVINDNGGTALAGNFTMNVTAANPSDDSFDGAEDPGTTITLDAGAYSVDEDAFLGYEKSIGTDCSGTIAVGEHKTCTITNDDIQPKITLIKHVINDNGGTLGVSDFPLFVNVTGVTSGVSKGFNAGNYTASETSKIGYSASSWSRDCAGDGSVTLNVGDDKTCEITNDDIAPQLTVIKQIVPDTDNGLFNLQIDGDTKKDDAGNGDSTGAVTVNAGIHTVGEVAGTGTDLSHYTAEINGDCATDGTITLAPAENKTCTITNTRKGHIIVDKVTIGGDATFAFDANGGSSPAYEDFSLSGADTPNDQELKPGAYSVSEGAVEGWDSDGGVCDKGETPASLDVEPGETVTCAFTNTKRGKITIVKDADPNDLINFPFSGTLGTFSLDDDSGVSGEDNTLSNSKSFSNQTTGDYIVTENLPNSFWTLKSVLCVITGTDDPYTNITPATNGVTIALDPGADVTCTFLNHKENPTRTQGFWQTHTQFTSNIFATNFPLGMIIGVSPHRGIITNIQVPIGSSQLFGAYYSNIAKKTTNQQRSVLDKARMQLLQQLVTAKLNCANFGCAASVQATITAADAAYAGSSTLTILASASLLDAYNNSGDALVIGNAGSATPRDSQNLADKAFWNLP